jgi:hypothetical protein
VVTVTRHPLDRSAAFTVLLHYAPWFAKTEARKAEDLVSRFLAAFYASGSTNIATYARGWAVGEPGRGAAGHGAELAARRTAYVVGRR